MKLKNLLKYGISIAFGGGLFWYLYKDKNIEDTWATFASVDYWWVGLSVLCAILSHYSRGLRWRLLLKNIHYHTHPAKAFIAVMLTYFVNLFIPRAGELARCGALQKMAGVPSDVSLGVVVAERALDFIMLLLFLAATLILEYEAIGNLFLGALDMSNRGDGLPDWLVWAVSFSVLALGIAGTALFIFRDRLKTHPFFVKLGSFLRGIKIGLVSILHLKGKDRLLFVGHTLFIWLMYFLMGYVLFFSVDATSGLPLGAGLSLLVAGGLGMAAPTPGGTGSYHFFVSKTLMAYNIAEQGAADFALLMHSSQTVFILIVGGAAFVLSMIIEKQQAGGDAATKPKA